MIDDLVAGLNPVHDDDITSEPSGPAGRELLAGVTALAPRRRRRVPRLAIGAVAAAGVAAAAVFVLPVQDSGPLRSYANAAVRVEVKGGEYEVEVKDAYAGQREFREAFAKVGLDARLSIVPVSPGRERTVIRTGPLHAPREGQIPPGGVTGTETTVLKCPPGQAACPLKVRLGGALFHLEGADIVIGREARPGEIYQDATPARGDRPASLNLTGRTVGQALAYLRSRNLAWSFFLGEFKPDGSGGGWNPPESWRPADGRRVTGAWIQSSDSVGLLVTPVKNDPRPTPDG